MKAGADIKNGEMVLKSGTLLSSREIGVLAALGIAEAVVYRIPCVAVFSTGPEVTEPGKALVSGKIYDINAYALSTAVRECGGKPLYLGVFPDDIEELQKALKQALKSANMVVTSGGVSVGPKDVIPKALASLGKPGIILSGIAIKPGKPTTIGLIGEKPAFLVTLKKGKSDKLLAEPVFTGDSGAITTLAKADGFVVVPENVQFIDFDQEVTVHLLGKNRQVLTL
jgi:putative molybdopterin biosynthesis protein